MEKELKCISISENIINSNYSALNKLLKRKFTFQDKSLPTTKNIYKLWIIFGLIDDVNKTIKDEVKINCLQEWCDLLYPKKVSVNNYHTDFIMTSKISKRSIYNNIVFPDKFCGTVYHIAQSLPKYDTFRKLTEIENECLNSAISILKSINIKLSDVSENLEISSQADLLEMWRCLGPDKWVINKEELTDELSLNILRKWLNLIQYKLDFDVRKLFEDYKSKTLTYRMKINKESYPNTHYSFENVSIETFIRDELIKTKK